MSFTTLTGINGTAYSIGNNTGSPVLAMGDGTTNDIQRASLTGISCQFENRSGNTLFIPANSAAEKQSVYANLGSVSGITMYRGHYHYPQDLSGTPKMYLIKSNMTNTHGGLCFTSSNYNGSTAPPDCDSGYTSESDSFGSVDLRWQIGTSGTFNNDYQFAGLGGTPLMTTNYHGTSRQLAWAWLNFKSMNHDGVHCQSAYPYGSVRARFCYRTANQFD